MLIPSDLAPEWLTSPNHPQPSVETQEQASTRAETAIQHGVTAWPTDAGKPPFIVGGVYTFPDIYGHERTALIYTEQWARVGSSWWHVGSVPDDAVFRDMFTPDAEMVADAERVALEILNSQRWS